MQGTSLYKPAKRFVRRGEARINMRWTPPGHLDNVEVEHRLTFSLFEQKCGLLTNLVPLCDAISSGTRASEGLHE